MALFAVALSGASVSASGLAPAAAASPPRSAYRAESVCAAPRPGTAACLGIRLVPASLTPAAMRVDARRQRAEAASGAVPAVTNKSPLGYLTPQQLHAAYALPTAPSSSLLQTIAVVDAYNDPTAEADLGVYDKQFGLPSCTTANGCFLKLNESGKTGPLPKTEGGWATEISLDVQMARAICQDCRVMLVEAGSSSFTDLGAAEEAAVKAGATEISNSYGGPEEAGDASYNAPYEHPGLVVTVSAGDCGYFNQGCRGAEVANYPASSPDVVAVGGTTLTDSGEGWSSTVWEGGGSGCSTVFPAPLWQSGVAGFAAAACGGKRLVADVAAVGNPSTGVDVYDSTPSEKGAPTGWTALGGTSVASPIVASEFALAGGSHGVEYPSATLYSNIGGGALYDVVSGSNGSCGGASSCKAAAGFDGPSGVGSPVGLGAFESAGAPSNTSPPTVTGAAEQGQTVTVKEGEWSGSPTSFGEQWALCKAAGSPCTAIAGATTANFAVPASDVGSTIRVQVSATNASGTSAPVLSAPSATVVSNAPKITGLAPSSGITGSTTTIAGTALNGAAAVHFGKLAAAFTVLSPTSIEAVVPNGASAGTISVTTPVKSATSSVKFTPTLSVVSFTPASAAPGTVVTITGVGFKANSTVGFNGKAAAVTYVSATKLKATVPAEAATGTLTVTNTAAPVGTVQSASAFTVS
jgi:hypothetical protein